MTQLRIDTLTIPAASLGVDNPFPQLSTSRPANAPMEASPEIPAEDQKYFGYGKNRTMVPYTLQDGYDRNRVPTEMRTLVLENEILRATFLPELGGRLWSLFHKPSNRELLYVNPVFQPANLALRNAWYSGGIEWNMSLIGHHPFTCAPLFAARVSDEEGNPVLRMYEWERIRGLRFQIDFSLPPGSPVLFVRVRLVNTNDFEIPSYWFSNIAVPEFKGQRVVAPADWAMSFSYGGGLQRINIPYPSEGVDLSYPTNIPSSNDFFFRIPDGVAPYIAALDQEGKGLFQASTARLKGRKLFVWGMEAGGRNWQDFLTLPGNPYVEIQAGLGRTQTECVPMPANAEWSWLEAYGLLEADGQVVHGEDWKSVTEHVAGKINELASIDFLEAKLKATEALADAPPEKFFQLGSGWAALEEARRVKAGEPSLASPGTVFAPETIGAEQAAWKGLLETGCYTSSNEGPRSWLVTPAWGRLLEEAVKRGSDNAETWLQLGVYYFAEGDVEKERMAYERSIALKPSVEALRNLGILAAREGNPAERLELLERAFGMAPSLRPLVVEYLSALRDANEGEKLVAIYESLVPSLKQDGRLQMIHAQGLLQLDRLAEVAEFLRSGVVVVDLKEGDNSLSNLWFAYHEKRLANEEGGLPADYSVRVRREIAPPSHLEYRMRIVTP